MKFVLDENGDDISPSAIKARLARAERAIGELMELSPKMSAYTRWCPIDFHVRCQLSTGGFGKTIIQFVIIVDDESLLSAKLWRECTESLFHQWLFYHLVGGFMRELISVDRFHAALFGEKHES